MTSETIDNNYIPIKQQDDQTARRHSYPEQFINGNQSGLVPPVQRSASYPYCYLNGSIMPPQFGQQIPFNNNRPFSTNNNNNFNSNQGNWAPMPSRASITQMPFNNNFNPYQQQQGFYNNYSQQNYSFQNQLPFQNRNFNQGNYNNQNNRNFQVKF
jgi:hypothetical protein